MNLPDSKLSTPALTTRTSSMQNCRGTGVDFLALSFVRAAADVTQLQRFSRVTRPISRSSARLNVRSGRGIDEILAVSYGIMVARGDLGIELPANACADSTRSDRTRAARAVPVIVARRCWNP